MYWLPLIRPCGRSSCEGERVLRILVLNSGGSSIKFKVFDFPACSVYLSGHLERVGQANSLLEISGAKQMRWEGATLDHAAGLELISQQLQDLGELGAVGHRVVHGATSFTGSVLVDDDVIAALRENIPLAPLHNPPNLAGIEASRKLFGDLVQVAVFDTGYHGTLPPQAYTYALPQELAKKWRIRRYGFHGIAFRSITSQAAELLGKKPEDLKIVSLMLGSGTTANACLYGKSADVSTGLTPLEGLVQSTRSGDLDPALVLYLMREAGYTADQLDRILNRESGWLGISGISADLREVDEAAKAGHEAAKLALDTFVYRTRKYIGAYAAAMGGIDLLAFSGGVGEHSSSVRDDVCRGLEFLGISLDPALNQKGEGIISRGSVPVVVVSANEEEIIAQDTYNLVSR